MKRFTVVLPVHNGGSHVQAAVASVLAQPLVDFDLVILENARTDGTAEWLRTLRDSRITVTPSATLLPIEENWRRILDTPRHEFMTILGHDDLFDPDFLRTIDALIRRFPDATLYQTHFRLIDADGEFIRHCRPMPSREEAADFLAARLTNLRDSFGTGYVVRSADFDRVGGIAVPGYRRLLFADDALWLSLLRGQNVWKATAPEECFSYRAHGQSTTTTSDVEDFFASLQHHRTFLETLSSEYSAVATVLARYGPTYFFDYCSSWHTETLRRHLGGEVAYPAGLRSRLTDFVQRTTGRDRLASAGLSRTHFYEWCDRFRFAGGIAYAVFSLATRTGRAGRRKFGGLPVQRQNAACSSR